MINYVQINERIASISFCGVPIGLIEKLISNEYMIDIYGNAEPIFLDIKYKPVISKFIRKVNEMNVYPPYTIKRNLEKLRAHKEFKMIE